jgi:hypothetical protein
MILVGCDFARILERFFENYLAEHYPAVDLIAQEEAHTRTAEPNYAPVKLSMGMGTPIPKDRDTSAVVYSYSPVSITFDPYPYTYAANCSYLGSNPSDEGTDERRWRKYWGEFLVQKKTPYRFDSGRSWRVAVTAMKHPCLSASRKKALTPAQHAQRKFVRRMMKPVRPLV